MDGVEETTSRIVYALDDISDREASREVIGSIRECTFRLHAGSPHTPGLQALRRTL